MLILYFSLDIFRLLDHVIIILASFLIMSCHMYEFQGDKYDNSD